MINITQIGDSLLRKKAQRVEKIDSSILKLIEQLKEAIAAYPNTIALAAPQLGLSVALFVARFPDDTGKENPYRIFINPKIKEPSKETWVLKRGQPLRTRNLHLNTTSNRDHHLLSR
jgi:peptide deformylase